MADYKVSDTQLTAVANAIRSKKGSSGQLAFPDGFVSEVGSIAAEVQSGNSTIDITFSMSYLNPYASVDTGYDIPGEMTSPVGNIYHWEGTGGSQALVNNLEFYVVYAGGKWNIYVRNKTSATITNMKNKVAQVTYKTFSAQIK